MKVYVASMSLTCNVSNVDVFEKFYERVTREKEHACSCIVVEVKATTPEEITNAQFLRDALDKKLSDLFNVNGAANSIKADIEAEKEGGVQKYDFVRLESTFASVEWKPGIPPRHDIEHVAIMTTAKVRATNTNTQVQWRLPVANKVAGYMYAKCEWRVGDVVQ